MTKSLVVPVVLAAATLTAVPAFAQHRGDRHRARGSRGAVVVRPHAVYVARRPVYAPRYYYYRPYYSFRPRFSIGFGISVGYPVAYPVYAPYSYGYPAPYAYPAPPPYAQSYPQQPYPSQQPYPGQQPYPLQAYPQGGYEAPQAYPNGTSSMQVQPPRDIGNTGGVSFEISPSDAQVFVDGDYVGTVDQFGPQTEPLQLSPGRHRIELRAQGMRPTAFDTTITAGQVIPYRGTLQQP
jgi:hypothetical protein